MAEVLNNADNAEVRPWWRRSGRLRLPGDTNVEDLAERFFGRNRVLHLDDLKGFGTDLHLQVSACRPGNLMQFVANYRQLTGLPKPLKKRLSAQEVLTHVARVAAADAGANPLALNVDVTPAGLEFHADPEQMEQVLINLLRNAEQALVGKHGAWIALSAFLSPRGHVTLEVRDNGPGIDANILPRVFVPYFTTKPEGIGLALARQIMMAHGGTIRAGNSDTGGAVFTLTF